MNFTERIIRFLRQIFKAITLSAVALAVVPSARAESRHVDYALSMSIMVPRVYDNMASKGYRKYQRQHVEGTVRVYDDGLTEAFLTNKTHKVNGVRVSYSTVVNTALWHLVGNNQTGVFKTPSVCLSIDALPSYVPTYTPTDDETLVLVLSGYGSSAKRIHGNVAGTLGCGCAWYGHTSPTREMFSCAVVDKAAVWGTFSLRRRAK